jgi:mannose-6-phosphate isomerase
MTRKLATHYVEKPWGRTSLPKIFDTDGRKIGEVWFQDTVDEHLPLLIKYLFTSEKLSIQVHPDDAQARAAGKPSGKEEIWYILECEPDAVIGVGLTKSLTSQELRAASLDGSIEELIDWRPVRPGDCYFIPAGTIHAIGAGITLAEVQQNADITYRLYDYGRPRELHLDQGIKVSSAGPYTQEIVCALPGEQAVLASTGFAPFWLELVHWQRTSDVHWPQQSSASSPIWFIPIEGSGTLGGERWATGECWLVDADCAITIDDGCSALIAGID